MKFKLNYIDNHQREETVHSDRPYDYDWYESYSYQYENAVISKENEYSDVALFPGEEEPKVGDTLYVAYVSYDSGDSFGHMEGAHTHLWAFTNAESAQNFCDVIKKDHEDSPNYNHKHEPLVYRGVPVNTNEWKGYFEHFNECTYVSLEVRAK